MDTINADGGSRSEEVVMHMDLRRLTVTINGCEQELLNRVERVWWDGETRRLMTVGGLEYVWTPDRWILVNG